MFRGDISNQPSPVILIDWRVLIDPKVSLSKASSELFHNYLLFDAKKEGDYFPAKRNAKGWLERNYKQRFCVFSVALEEPFKIAVENVLEELVAEIEHFESRDELRDWLRINNQVSLMITNDNSFLGLDDNVRLFVGWGSVAEYL